MHSGAVASIILLTVVHFIGVALLIWSIAGTDALKGIFRLSADDDGGTPLDGAPEGPRDGGRDGLPLPDAEPARVRLREDARIGDRLPRRPRRPDHAPAPAEPVREREAS